MIRVLRARRRKLCVKLLSRNTRTLLQRSLLSDSTRRRVCCCGRGIAARARSAPSSATAAASRETGQSYGRKRLLCDPHWNSPDATFGLVFLYVAVCKLHAVCNCRHTNTPPGGILVAFVIRHRSAGGCCSSEFGVGQIKGHGRILAPGRGGVQAVPGKRRYWIRARP